MISRPQEQMIQLNGMRSDLRLCTLVAALLPEQLLMRVHMQAVVGEKRALRGVTLENVP